MLSFREAVRSRSLHHLCIVIVGLLAYSNTYSVPFLFDDLSGIVDNPLIKSLGFYLHPSSASSFGPLQYQFFLNRYVGDLTFALNYWTHGLDVFGYHLVNISIHLLNGLLIYHLVDLFMSATSCEQKSRSLIPLVASLLFISHPLQTQAVTFIYQRYTSLGTFFILAALVLYARFRRLYAQAETPWMLQGLTLYGGALVVALLAMKTKEIAFTLPLLICMYELSFTGKARNYALLVPFLCTMPVIPLTILFVQRGVAGVANGIGDAARMKAAMSHGDYLLTQIKVIMTYLRLIFLPVRQNLDYDYPIVTSFFRADVILSFMALLILAGGTLFLFRKVADQEQRNEDLRHARLFCFGLAWFFITLSVESTVYLVDVIFEHRMYLPSIGLFVALASGGEWLVHRCERLRKPVAIIIPLVIVALAATTFVRNRVWRSPVTLWDDAAKKSPNNARAHINLGIAYDKVGEPDLAVIHYRRALALDPSSEGVYNNLGMISLKKGNYPQAIEYFRAGIAITPDSSLIYSNLGSALEDAGRLDEAALALKRAIALDSNDETAYYNLGRVCFKKGLYREAEAAFGMSLSLNPGNRDALHNLEVVRAAMK